MFHLNQLKETTVDVLKSDDTELQDTGFSFTASNMQARHNDAASYLVQKITTDITDTFDHENLAQRDLLNELTLGRLMVARYLVAGRVFIINAPAPLARAITDLPNEFSFSTGAVGYRLKREDAYDLDNIGASAQKKSTIEWLEIKIAPGTEGTPAQHKEDITRALKDVGINSYQIDLLRKDAIKYNVKFTTEPTFTIRSLKKLFDLRLGQGKYVTFFFSPAWRDYMGFYECCLEGACYCSGNKRKRNMSSLDRKDGAKRQTEMDQKRFKRLNPHGAGPSS